MAKTATKTPTSPTAPTAPAPIEHILALKAQGLTHAEIAASLQLTVGAIDARLSRYNKGEAVKSKAIDLFKKNRADILAGLQRKIIKCLDANTLKKASASQLFMGLGVCYDKERLERGESTANIASQNTIAVLQLRARQDTVPPGEIEEAESGD